jgi:hypothetical protein
MTTENDPQKPTFFMDGLTKITPRWLRPHEDRITRIADVAFEKKWLALAASPFLISIALRILGHEVSDSKMNTTGILAAYSIIGLTYHRFRSMGLIGNKPDTN